MPKNQRRGGWRMPLTLRVLWTADGGGEEEAATGNVSEDGCFLTSPAPVMVGEEISMRTRLSTGVWLHIRGRVVHRLESGFGVTFGTLSEDTRSALSGLLEEHRERIRGLGGGRIL